VLIFYLKRLTLLDDDHCDRKLHVSRANPDMMIFFLPEKDLYTLFSCALHLFIFI